MEKRLILIKEYCQASSVEPTFVDLLVEEELIQVQTVSGEQFIDEDQLDELEQFIRWHYDMHINLEGIDALRHLLYRVKNLQKEIAWLRDKLDFYE